MSRSSFHFVRSFLFVVLLTVVPSALLAQTPAGVSGVVRDASGAPVPGASVRVLPGDGRASAETVTDAAGRYEISNLAAGPHRVEATLDGFETVVRDVTLQAGAPTTADVVLVPARLNEGVVVTARRVEEEAQEVPIPVSVVSGTLAADAGAFNVNRLKELIPAVQFYSTNPRNSAINIRGLGAPFGLTNDGIDPGVGLYIDGVFHGRPASATLDFLDVAQVEVLRGPQGTLFGKNTTAGAVNVTTRRPTFAPEGDFELNLGNFGFVQAKASLSGRLFGNVAGRVSFSGTQRDGTVQNVRTGEDVNVLSNSGVRGQVTYAPSGEFAVLVSADYTRQRPRGYTQVVAGVAPTLRPASRQYPAIAADLGYTPPSFNAFARLTDIDSPLRSNQGLGGGAVNLDLGLGRGRLTSTTAWRFWDWDPSNDRDFIGLPVTSISAAPSRQEQWTQEVRYAGNLAPRIDVVIGGFYFDQSLDSNPTFRQEQGAAAWRFLLAPTAAAATPGLLDGYGADQYVTFDNVSAAVFGQIEWAVTDRLRVLPGLRFNYDDKSVDFDQQVYGGLQTTDPTLVALQRSVLAPQAYSADIDDTNLSGQATVAYNAATGVNLYATYGTGFKSVGLNLTGLPTDALGRPILDAAVVAPEDVRNVEIGVKTDPFPGVTANLTVFNTSIRDFQTQVVNADIGVLRGYLANADQVRVRGAEFDTTARIGRHVTTFGSVVFTDGKYVSFPDAPPPLEETGGPQVKDISGSVLPGISRWALAYGGEYSAQRQVFGRSGEFFVAYDGSYRSSFSSSPSASKYLFVDGYALANLRAGFRAASGWTLFLWSRNLLGRDYFELMSAQPGNSGLYVGQPGDPRTVGVTLRVAYRADR